MSGICGAGKPAGGFRRRCAEHGKGDMKTQYTDPEERQRETIAYF